MGVISIISCNIQQNKDNKMQSSSLDYSSQNQGNRIRNYINGFISNKKIRVSDIHKLYHAGNKAGAILFSIKTGQNAAEFKKQFKEIYGIEGDIINKYYNKNKIENLGNDLFEKYGDIFTISMILEYLIYNIHHHKEKSLRYNNEKDTEKFFNDFDIENKFESYIKPNYFNDNTENLQPLKDLKKECKKSLKKVKINKVCMPKYWEIGKKLHSIIHGVEPKRNFSSFPFNTTSNNYRNNITSSNQVPYNRQNISISNNRNTIQQFLNFDNNSEKIFKYIEYDKAFDRHEVEHEDNEVSNLTTKFIICTALLALCSALLIVKAIY